MSETGVHCVINQDAGCSRSPVMAAVPQILTLGRGAWKGPWGTATGGAAENSQAHAQRSEPLAETGRRNSTNSTTARHIQRVWTVTGGGQEGRGASELGL